jgi:hypothetical protein
MKHETKVSGFKFQVLSSYSFYQKIILNTSIGRAIQKSKTRAGSPRFGFLDFDIVLDLEIKTQVQNCYDRSNFAPV